MTEARWRHTVSCDTIPGSSLPVTLPPPLPATEGGEGEEEGEQWLRREPHMDSDRDPKTCGDKGAAICCPDPPTHPSPPTITAPTTPASALPPAFVATAMGARGVGEREEAVVEGGR
jgi:hypothetical protein